MSNIHAFARRGDLRALKMQVEDFAADVNQPDVHKMTALHYSAKRGHLAVVKYLVERNAALEVPNGTGQSPLAAAAQSGQAEVVDHLILSNANPNSEADHGVRPLHRAAGAGHDGVVRMLLKGRADPLAIDGFLMEGAIHHASREGHSDVVRTLVGSVTRPTIREDDEVQAEYAQALRAMTSTSTSEIAGICGLRAQSIDEGNSRGETALHLAAANGKIDCVWVLLKMGTAGWKQWWIERKDGRSGDTSLHRACAESQAEVVRLLLDEKANPSLTNNLGRTPMHLAVKAGDATIIKYLMRAGASQMDIDLDGRRPIAAGAGPWKVAPPDGLKVEYWIPHKSTLEEQLQHQHNESMVKQSLADMGTGYIGARQGYITKTRQDNQNARRKAAWRMAASGGFTVEDVEKRDRENEARNQRNLVRKYESDRANVEWRLRSAWAHKKIKQVWQDYKYRKEEKRREAERQKRKAEADRLRRQNQEMLAAQQNKPKTPEKPS